MAKAYVLQNQGAWNPMSRYPRNSQCPCGSGKKWKHCHMNQSSMAIDKKDAAGLKQIVETAKAHPNVVYKKSP